MPNKAFAQSRLGLKLSEVQAFLIEQYGGVGSPGNFLNWRCLVVNPTFENAAADDEAREYPRSGAAAIPDFEAAARDLLRHLQELSKAIREWSTSNSPRESEQLDTIWHLVVLAEHTVQALTALASIVPVQHEASLDGDDAMFNAMAARLALNLEQIFERLTDGIARKLAAP